MGVTSYYSFGGEIIGEETGGVRRDYLTDALGSVTATVTGAGAVENTYRYKPYGEQLAKTGTGSDPKFLWNGKSGYNSNAFGNYVRSRSYLCKNGSWTSKDLLLSLGESMYSYAFNNPCSLSDPSGLKPNSEDCMLVCGGSEKKGKGRNRQQKTINDRSIFPIQVKCKNNGQQKIYPVEPGHPKFDCYFSVCEKQWLLRRHIDQEMRNYIPPIKNPGEYFGADPYMIAKCSDVNHTLPYVPQSDPCWEAGGDDPYGDRGFLIPPPGGIIGSGYWGGESGCCNEAGKRLCVQYRPCKIMHDLLPIIGKKRCDLGLSPYNNSRDRGRKSPCAFDIIPPWQPGQSGRLNHPWLNPIDWITPFPGPVYPINRP